MNKKGLISSLCQENVLGLNKTQMSCFIDEFFSVVKRVLSSGEDVKIRGFGSFQLHKIPGAKIRVPSIQREIVLKERWKVKFLMSKELRNHLRDNV